MLSYSVSITYMIGGYSAIFVILAAYLASLFLRWRRLKGELDILEELDSRE